MSETFTRALSIAVVEGVKVTLRVQLALGPRVVGELGQLLVCAKSLLFAPVTVIPVIVSAWLPVFVKVTVCGALVVPTFCAGNARLLGEKETVGPVPLPVPVRLIV